MGVIWMRMKEAIIGRGFILFFAMFTIVSCNLGPISPRHPIQERIDSDEVEEGERPFLQGSVTQVCILQDGEVSNDLDMPYDGVPLDWIAIVEYRDDEIFIGYARNDEVNHNQILDIGNPTCFDNPNQLYLSKLDGAWIIKSDN